MFRSCLVFTLFVLTSTVVAQETGDFPKPAAEHEFLKKFVGEWTTQSSCKVAPGADPIEGTGKINSRMLGEFWVVNDMESSVGGTTFTAIHTVGYDKKSGKYVATWIDSMSDFMWKYDGTVKGNTLVFEAEGPNYMVPGAMMKYRDTYEFLADDEMRLKSEAFDDGKWSTFMSGTANRKSSVE